MLKPLVLPESQTARPTAGAMSSQAWVSGWPDLLAEWHPTRNGTLRPEETSHGSGRKVWWRCPRGPDHEWRATPNNRTSGKTGCPFCAGRRASVTNSVASVRPDLAAQWDPVRNRGLTPDRVASGSTRPAWWRCLAEADHGWRVSPRHRLGTDGRCPFCTGARVSATNSLAATDATIAAEWHPSKNGSLTPRDVVGGSGRSVWWRCQQVPAHEWQTSVSNRSVRSSGCPYCSGRKASAEHCLATAYPDIALQWHPARNGAFTPESVTPYARLGAWWQCEHGHEWLARVGTRTRKGTGCPRCRDNVATSLPASAAPQPDPSPEARSATRYLREEHRRLQQVLVLLVACPDVDERTSARFSTDLAAHVHVKESLLYPALERAGAGPLKEQHRLGTELRVLLRRGMSRAPNEHLRRTRLAHLKATFDAYIRLDEAGPFPFLDRALSRSDLEALAGSMSELRAAFLLSRDR